MSDKAFDADADSAYPQKSSAFGTQVAGDIIPLRMTAERTVWQFMNQRNSSAIKHDMLNSGEASRRDLGMQPEDAAIIPLKDPRR